MKDFPLVLTESTINETIRSQMDIPRLQLDADSNEDEESYQDSEGNDREVRMQKIGA